MVPDSVNPTSQKDEILTVWANAFKLLKQSWQGVKLNLGTFLLLYLTPFILVAILLAILLPAIGLGALLTNGEVDFSNASVTATAGVAIFIGLLGLIVLSVYLSIASIITQFKSIRGEKIGFVDAINQSSDYFWRFIGLAIVSSLIILAGLILLILPGLLAIFFLLLASYFLIDKNTTIREALKGSFEITKANWKIVTALVVVQAAVSAIGIIEGIGSFVSLLLAFAYLCLPAILYTRAAQKNGVTKKSTAKKPANKQVKNA